MADNSILTLASSGSRYQMFAEDRQFLKDADIGQLEGTRMQYAEIMADCCGGLFADRCALHAWLSELRYPISFLDFEWERYAIPPYAGMKPYDVMPFEYSLHILEQDGRLSHQVYLGVHDDRYELARQLVQSVPNRGSVIAYNAEGAEKIRIQEFADLYPDLRNQLLDINKRMLDLQQPFVSGSVYDVRMRGQWTLKNIMNMLDDKSYHDLDINQGMQAVFEWRHLDRHDEAFDTTKISDDLKKYCGMDSYSMVVILKWLISIDHGTIKEES